MENLKDPAMILGGVNTLGLLALGAIGYKRSKDLGEKIDALNTGYIEVAKETAKIKDIETKLNQVGNIVVQNGENLKRKDSRINLLSRSIEDIEDLLDNHQHLMDTLVKLIEKSGTINIEKDFETEKGNLKRSTGRRQNQGYDRRYDPRDRTDRRDDPRDRPDRPDRRDDRDRTDRRDESREDFEHPFGRDRPGRRDDYDGYHGRHDRQDRPDRQGRRDDYTDRRRDGGDEDDDLDNQITDWRSRR